MPIYETPDGRIVADESFIVATYAEGEYSLVELPAPAEPEPLTWATADDPRLHWLDLGPFCKRFGALTIPILASTNATVQACIKLLTVSKYIDLLDPQVSQMVDLIISAGYAIDKSAVLNPITTEFERHIKNLPQPQEVAY